MPEESNKLQAAIQKCTTLVEIFTASSSVCKGRIVFRRLLCHSDTNHEDSPCCVDLNYCAVPEPQRPCGRAPAQLKQRDLDDHK